MFGWGKHVDAGRELIDAEKFKIIHKWKRKIIFHCPVDAIDERKTPKKIKQRIKNLVYTFTIRFI